MNIRLVSRLAALWIFAVISLSHPSLLAEEKTQARKPTAAIALQPPGYDETPLSKYEIACEALRKTLRKSTVSNAAKNLKAVFEFDWDYSMTTYPEWATYVGDPRGQDSLTDMSLASLKLRKREARCPLQLIKAIHRDHLKSPEDKLSYDLFLRDAEKSIESQVFPEEFLIIDQMGGIHQDIPQLLSVMSRVSPADFENRLKRLEKVPTRIRQHLELLKMGLQNGITPPRSTLKGLPSQIEPLLRTPIEKNPLFESFLEMPTSIDESRRKAIEARAMNVISTHVIPAFRELRDFLTQEYIPNSRQKIAFTSLPNGSAWYENRVRKYTTTDLLPQDIHQIGLDESKRLLIEMDQAMKRAGWKKSRAAFFQFLRTDPQFFFKTPDQLLAAYRDIAKRADPELSRLFGRLPRLTYGVKAIPDFAAKESPTAYYQSGSVEAGRPGWFLANTYDLKSRPKWEMEALTLHEAVPGHHLQISIAQDMENVPRFRKEISFTAFIEGWALYAESLGREMGFYRDTYSDVGRITYEMWRANRLVVDTGMHAMGWSREKAIEFMRSHLPKPVHDIEVEVDRYIVWPGQALAYKIGQLKFLELRRRAETRLGDAFDIRLFHDLMLESGALPLDVLERKFNAWLNGQKAKN